MERTRTKLFLLFLSISLLLLGFYAFASSQSHAQSGPVLLSSNVLGKAVTTSDYVFWVESKGQNQVINGYNLNSHTQFQVAGSGELKSELASDGQSLAWVQGTPGNASIEGYDLGNGKRFAITPAHSGNEFGSMALSNGRLYYKDASLNHNGLYAWDINAKQEKLISAKGQNPVAAGNILLWSEEQYQGELLPGEWSLHLSKLDGSLVDSVIAKATGQFQVTAAGDNILWSALPPAKDPNLYLYSITSGKTKALSSKSVTDPVLSDSKVAWIDSPSAEPDQPNRWSVQLYDITSGTSSAFVKPGTARIQLNGFAGDATLAFTVSKSSTSGTNELYLAQLDQSGMNFNGPVTPKAVTNPTNPFNCGQVYKNGYQLYDCNGRWPVNGVQFILPERGINGQTFWDTNYNTSAASGQVDYWLDRASNLIGAKMLRIFVDMPGSNLPGPTSPATLYDFAARAASKGMRVGIVLHNDSSWTLTPARKQWLSDFVAYFKSKNALPLIAYVNADNEINNHCGNGADCFDNNPAYVNAANQWVADFTKYVKSLNASILVTVGLSTEKASSDSQATSYDFFRTTGSAPSLATSVDFLSPHSYHGGGFTIWPALRYDLTYKGPIVLEEYGYPTDVLSQSPFYTEGPAVCLSNPFDPTCNNTAPYFVDVNARSIRENNIDGFAGGSAWMLADSNRKDCNSPMDFYTGLIASGDYPKCNQNGTTTTSAGALKATGARIRYFYTGTLNEPPVAPNNLTAKAGSSTEIKLNWSDNSDNEQSFRIERKTGTNGNWAEVGSTPANATSYADSKLQDNTTYFYRVRAYADNGTASYSIYSNETSATTPLAAPANLTVTAISLIQLNLSWSDNSSSVLAFEIERKSGANGNWTKIAQTGPDNTAYSDIGLEQSTGYYYRVRAVTKKSASDYSNEANATTKKSADFTVTSPDDNGSGGNGTLSYALTNARSGQTILLVPTGNNLVISQGQFSIPAGVTLIGRCGSAGPEISIKGSPGKSGLALNGGNSIIYGLKISGFQGPLLSSSSSSNYLKCVKVTNE
ncbi:MAG TPA: fibronectin type III domain-containing protein [Chloroflexia bacterium]|nr:fibronectin type III domain-containing protein [Chloroflexia bacterium]